MRHPVPSILLTLLALWMAAYQERTKPEVEGNGVQEGVKCAENKDKRYPRRETLERFAAVLNDSIPEFEERTKFKFSLDGEHLIGFGVYDLTDPSNSTSYGAAACVKFIDGHVYHVVPAMNDFSFSHIIILEGGSLKVFRSVNCQGRGGDKLEDVLAYLNTKLADDKNRDEIIKRVKGYRKYGAYVRMDNFSGLMCKPVEDHY